MIKVSDSHREQARSWLVKYVIFCGPVQHVVDHVAEIFATREHYRKVLEAIASGQMWNAREAACFALGLPSPGEEPSQYGPLPSVCTRCKTEQRLDGAGVCMDLWSCDRRLGARPSEAAHHYNASPSVPCTECGATWPHARSICDERAQRSNEAEAPQRSGYKHAPDCSWISMGTGVCECSKRTVRTGSKAP